MSNMVRAVNNNRRSKISGERQNASLLVRRTSTLYFIIASIVSWRSFSWRSSYLLLLAKVRSMPFNAGNGGPTIASSRTTNVMIAKLRWIWLTSTWYGPTWVDIILVTATITTDLKTLPPSQNKSTRNPNQLFPAGHTRRYEQSTGIFSSLEHYLWHSSMFVLFLL